MKRSQFLGQFVPALLLATTGLGVGLPGSAPAAADSMAVPTGPLSRSDPRAQLDPKLLEAQPMPAPQWESQALLPPGEGEREVRYVPSTRQTFIAPPKAAGFKIQGRDQVRMDEGHAPRRGASIAQVVGPDDRVVVGNTAVFPWSTHCKLYMTFPNGDTMIGSGTLIGPRTVITAGHCVYSHDKGGWATEIEVIPGFEGHLQAVRLRLWRPVPRLQRLDRQQEAGSRPGGHRPGPVDR